MPDVHVGYFIDTAQRMMTASSRGEPVRVIGPSGPPIHVFGYDGGGGRFAVGTDDGAVYYLPSSGEVLDSKYFETDRVQMRRVADSVSELVELLERDVRAFVRGTADHRYIVDSRRRD